MKLPLMPVPMVVVIPTHGRPDLLQRTLASLLECRLPVQRNVRCVVVENGGQHGAQALVHRLAGDAPLPLAYLHWHEGNKSAALNHALQHFGDELLLMLDDDVRAHPDLLLHYDRAAGNARGGQFLGGGVLVDYEQAPEPWVREHLPPTAKGWHPLQHEPIGALQFPGPNWAAFAPDLLAAGGFDRRVGPGGDSGGTGQETRMQKALMDLGCKPVYVRDAVVWHYVPRDRCSPDWAARRVYRNALTQGLLKQVPASQLRIGGVPLHYVRSAVVAATAWAASRLSPDPAARFAARAGLARAWGHVIGTRLQARGGSLRAGAAPRETAKAT